MSISHAISRGWSGQNGTPINPAPAVFSASEELNLDFALAGNTTNQQENLAFTKSLLQSIYIYSDLENVTIKTQNVSLSTPASPVLGFASGGTLSSTTYYVRITYVNGAGETLASTEVSFAVGANNVLVVASPAASGAGSYAATGWNVYVSSSTGTETKQNGATPIAIGTNWTEPTTGLVAGGSLPGSNTTAAPQDTMTLTAGEPVVWDTTSPLACPFAGNVTAGFFTNGVSTATNVHVRCLTNG